MTTAQLAAKLIAVFEGCRLQAYYDTGGVLTIGFGHTAGVQISQQITMDQAIALLEQDQKPLLDLVADKPILEAAALVSFGYNCGIGNLKKVLDGSGDILSHTKDRRGNILPGLVSRRNLEAALIEVSRGK